MKYDPEMEDTGFWCGSWGTVAMKSLGLGKMLHAFNPRRKRQTDIWVQGQLDTEQVTDKEKLKPCWGKLLTGSGTSAREWSLLLANARSANSSQRVWKELEIRRVLWRWTNQSLEFTQMVFCLALVQYFLTMIFWNGNIYPVWCCRYVICFMNLIS